MPKFFTYEQGLIHSLSKLIQVFGGMRDNSCLLPIKMHWVFLEFNSKPFLAKYCFTFFSVSSVRAIRSPRLLIVSAYRN